VLGPGDPIPVARVWAGPGEGPLWLADVLAGEPAVLCFYLWDWSPT
jgi:hypothetical protein